MAKPTSFDVTDTLTVPNAVSCGVPGSFKKLNTELPPIVCPERHEEINANDIRMIIRKRLS